MSVMWHESDGFNFAAVNPQRMSVRFRRWSFPLFSVSLQQVEVICVSPLSSRLLCTCPVLEQNWSLLSWAGPDLFMGAAPKLCSRLKDFVPSRAAYFEWIWLRNVPLMLLLGILLALTAVLYECWQGWCRHRRYCWHWQRYLWMLAGLVPAKAILLALTAVLYECWQGWCRHRRYCLHWQRYLWMLAGLVPARRYCWHWQQCYMNALRSVSRAASQRLYLEEVLAGIPW